MIIICDAAAAQVSSRSNDRGKASARLVHLTLQCEGSKI